MAAFRARVVALERRVLLEDPPVDLDDAIELLDAQLEGSQGAVDVGLLEQFLRLFFAHADREEQLDALPAVLLSI